jgi:predicted Zn finger-like uncharacterized protein
MCFSRLRGTGTDEQWHGPAHGIKHIAEKASHSRHKLACHIADMLRVRESIKAQPSMILTCPSCSARYVVPDSSIGPTGRRVRCAGCRHSWYQEPPSSMASSPEPEPEPPPFASPPHRAPEPRAQEARAQSAPPLTRSEPVAPPLPEAEHRYDPYAEGSFLRPRRNPAKYWTIAVIVAAALMGAAAVAIWVFGLPQLGQRIGIPVQAGDALAISATIERHQLESGNEMLEVSGEITNRTDAVQRVPQIRAELRDSQGQIVHSWTIAPPVRELQPRDRVSINSAEIDVPQGGRMLRLTFGGIT